MLSYFKETDKHRLNINKFHSNYSHFPPRLDPVLVLLMAKKQVSTIYFMSPCTNVCGILSIIH